MNAERETALKLNRYKIECFLKNPIPPKNAYYSRMTELIVQGALIISYGSLLFLKFFAGYQ